MKLASKEEIITAIENEVAEGAWSGEEIDTTAKRIYQKIVEPLVLAINSETR